MKEQSSQARPDHRNVCEKIEGDRPTASGTEGSLERFPKSRFLKVVFYGWSTSTSTGALRRFLTLCASGHTR